MSRDGTRISRRELLRVASAAGLAMPFAGLGLTDAQRVFGASPKPGKLVFLGWTFGKIYEGFAARFKQDHDVNVDMLLEPNVEQAMSKLISLLAAREQVDGSKVIIQSLGEYIQRRIILPIDEFPGAGAYIDQFTPFTKESLQYQGRTWGLPYFSTIWLPLYNEEKLERARMEPFKTWDELVEQARRAKREGVARYPLLWVAGVGHEQLPGTWFTLTWNRGGVIFTKDLKPELGPGSVARETLRWWQRTFTEELSDPRSLEVRFIPAARLFNSGDYLYLLPTQHYYIVWNNDPAQSPIAGKVRFMMMPGDGRTLGFTNPYVITRGTRNPEWAWTLLQYLAGKTKTGEWMQPNKLMRDWMLGSGYKSLMLGEIITREWPRWGNIDVVINQWQKASSILEVAPAMREPWYIKWSDLINVQLQDCLRGKTTADQACDNMIRAIDEAKRRA